MLSQIRYSNTDRVVSDEDEEDYSTLGMDLNQSIYAYDSDHGKTQFYIQPRTTRKPSSPPFRSPRMVPPSNTPISFSPTVSPRREEEEENEVINRQERRRTLQSKSGFVVPTNQAW